MRLRDSLPHHGITARPQTTQIFTIPPVLPVHPLPGAIDMRRARANAAAAVLTGANASSLVTVPATPEKKRALFDIFSPAAPDLPPRQRSAPTPSLSTSHDDNTSAPLSSTNSNGNGNGHDEHHDDNEEWIMLDEGHYARLCDWTSLRDECLARPARDFRAAHALAAAAALAGHAMTNGNGSNIIPATPLNAGDNDLDNIRRMSTANSTAAKRALRTDEEDRLQLYLSELFLSSNNATSTPSLPQSLPATPMSSNGSSSNKDSKRPPPLLKMASAGGPSTPNTRGGGAAGGGTSDRDLTPKTPTKPPLHPSSKTTDSLPSSTSHTHGSSGHGSHSSSGHASRVNSGTPAVIPAAIPEGALLPIALSSSSSSSSSSLLVGISRRGATLPPAPPPPSPSLPSLPPVAPVPVQPVQAVVGIVDKKLADCIASLKLAAVRQSLARVLSAPSNNRKLRLSTSAFRSLRMLVWNMLTQCQDHNDWLSAKLVLESGGRFYHEQQRNSHQMMTWNPSLPPTSYIDDIFDDDGVVVTMDDASSMPPNRSPSLLSLSSDTSVHTPLSSSIPSSSSPPLPLACMQGRRPSLSGGSVGAMNGGGVSVPELTRSASGNVRRQRCDSLSESTTYFLERAIRKHGICSLLSLWEASYDEEVETARHEAQIMEMQQAPTKRFSSLESANNLRDHLIGRLSRYRHHSLASSIPMHTSIGILYCVMYDRLIHLMLTYGQAEATVAEFILAKCKVLYSHYLILR
jgi:hypothetical protein